MANRQFDQLFTPVQEKRIAANDEGLDSLLHQPVEAGLNLLRSTGVQDMNLPAKQARGCLDVCRLGGRLRIRRIEQEADHRGLRDEFEKQIEPLRPQIST